MEASTELTEDSGSTAPVPVPGEGANAEETSLFTDQEAYLEAWQQFFAPLFPFKEDAARPDSVTLNRQIEEISRRASRSLEAGIQFPVESFLLSHNLDLVDRILFMALACETRRIVAVGESEDAARTILTDEPWVVQGSCFSNLCALLDIVASVSPEEVEQRLERDGVLPSLGLVERFGFATRKTFRYRIAPRRLDVISGKKAFPVELSELDEPDDGLYEQFLRLLWLVYAAAVNREDTDWNTYISCMHRAECWTWESKNPVRGDWDPSETGRIELEHFIQALSRAAMEPFGKLVKELDLDSSSSMTLAILILIHAHGHAETSGRLIKAVAGLGRKKDPSIRDVIGPAAPLVTSGVIQVHRKGPLMSWQLAISPRYRSSLVPYSITPPRPSDQRVAGDPVTIVESDGRTLDGLVLSPDLRESLVFHTRHLLAASDTLVSWGFRNKSHVRVALLFHGPPGTGKTAAARAIATEQRRVLYQLRLDQVFSKWFGESEKLVAAAFRRAEEDRALLLLDEADSLLGDRDLDSSNARTGIKCLLLQEIEAFAEPLILATNRLGALDSALERRLTATLEFPLPGIPERRALWKLYLPTEAPLAGDVDFDSLARSFQLSGAGIERACVQAAAVAATRPEPDRVIRMSDLVASARRGTPRTSSVTPSAPLFKDGPAQQLRQLTDWDLDN